MLVCKHWSLPQEQLGMLPRKEENHNVSRRAFLRGMVWAPVVFLPAPLLASPFRFLLPASPDQQTASLAFSDSRIKPHYPAKSPLEDVVAKVFPGGDEYLAEKYVFEIIPLLRKWSEGLKTAPPASSVLRNFLHASIEAGTLAPFQEISLRSDHGMQVFRRRFAQTRSEGRDRFLDEMNLYLSPLFPLETAEFEVVRVKQIASAPLTIECSIRYDLVGIKTNGDREQRTGYWETTWSRDESKHWAILRWTATEETLCRVRAPAFVEITAQALGQTESYRRQMLRGVDHWRTVLDGACGIDIYGNNGLAAGDIDNDGWDDMYVCQPAGLPNRLYRNRGDGTFEDVTEKAGVGVLDGTACALFADFENKGLQDLLVVCGNGPLLFLNQGNGEFSLKRDAFKFLQPPQGTFTHAAVADYDHDGRLDIYFCLYSYYLGLDQYHYPAPYFDARNGPPNFLLHNEGNAVFQDRTAEAGLNAENDRYSFACAWGDSNSNGWPDLYVANDFGRNNLYRNQGDGKFAAVSSEAGVQDAGAGMSACWFDSNGDGNQDIYVGNMWSAAGIRISEQNCFHEKDPENIRALYRRHARGNSLYRNLGDGHFENASAPAGVETGRWAWSSDAWDFDHDGYPDLYVANGYISGPDTLDLSSFFWRQLVAQSPQNEMPSPSYERAWNAINELIRADVSWSGYERNIVFANNRDGSFSDVSGAVGLDFPEDSRSFALADLDHDGRLEIILKNRNAPQIRILHNVMKELGNAVAFRLRGQKSNRDAIGAAVTIDAGGRRQTKYLQAGSGFLSQHTKELFFGVGNREGVVDATVRWPSGLTQVFEHLPLSHRIEIVEGSADFRAYPFANSPPGYARAGDPPNIEPLPSSVQTWLLELLSAPQFSLPDASGRLVELASFRGRFLLLTFWQLASAPSQDQLRRFGSYQAKLKSGGVEIAAVNLDAQTDVASVRSWVKAEGLFFPTLFATEDVAGVYNLIYRHLFDRRRDLSIPTSFLLNENGMIVKVYQGPVGPEAILDDVRQERSNPDDRARRALPFGGKLYQSTFERNDFTYGVAFFQLGYLDQAAESFQQVIAAKPNEPEAYYNLGTLYLRRNDIQTARRYLEETVKLRPNHAEAWNNLGMVAAEEGHADEAIANFERSLLLKPGYTVALLNLGNLYRRQGVFSEAENLLSRAVELEPENAEVNYSFGMLFAQQNQIERAAQYLQQAVNLRSGYPDALNNLGVVFVRQQRYAEAEAKFKSCIQAAPDFDQAYMNLARLYMILDDSEKAKEALLALLRRQPENKGAQQALDRVH
jgi:tetratricopeptide (TPR) repeat protein/peroxiredoxin